MALQPTGPFVSHLETGVVLALYAIDQLYDFEIQRAPDVDGDPGTFETIAGEVAGSTELYVDRLPIDDARYWYRIRDTGLGDTPSDWIGPIVATADVLPASPQRPLLSTLQLDEWGWTDSADGLFRTYTWTCGQGVSAVLIFNTLVKGAVGSFPKLDDKIFPVAVLPRSITSYTAAKPPQGSQRLLRFEARTAAGRSGDVRLALLDAAPSALAVTIRVRKTDGIADLELDVEASTSNFPVRLTLCEDDPNATPIYSATLTAAGVITKLTAGASALGGRVLPLRGSRVWYAKLVDVAGIPAVNFASANRDPLPAGTVTITDYQAAPVARTIFDTDTDTVRITTPSGKTKTWAVAESGSRVYTLGDLLDDGTAESALAAGVTTGTYIVEIQGGGVWVTLWAGPLHGAQGLTYNQVLTQVTASDADTITVTVTATAANGTPTVQLVSVTGSAARISGPLPGVASPSGTVWVFSRGAAFGPAGQALFRALYTGNISDDKPLIIPEKGRDTVYVTTRARVLSSTPTQVVARVAVADPYPTGTGSLTYLVSGGASVDLPASIGIIPSATMSEAAGSYVDYTITRPVAGSGDARVTFLGSAPGRVSDPDAVDVPAQETNFTIPTLELGTPTITSSDYAIPYTSTGAVSYKIGSSAYAVTTGNPQIILRTSVDQLVTFRAISNGQAITKQLTVLAIGSTPGGGGPPVPSITGWSNVLSYAPQQVTISWSGANLPSGGVIYTVVVEEQQNAADRIYSRQIFPGQTSPLVFNTFDTFPVSSGTNTRKLRITILMADSTNTNLLVQSATRVVTYNVL